MRIAAAIAITFSGLYFASAPTAAQATAVVRNNTCFSGVSSDEADAREECARAGFTCTAPKVMKCRFDNVRQMYLCQCKDPPKNPRPYMSDGKRKTEDRTAPPAETQPPAEQVPPPPAEQQPPGALASAATGC